METQKLSGEGLAIQMKMERLYTDLQLLDESIVRYIDKKGGEAVSYRRYFDKRFPQVSSQMIAISSGIEQLLELEVE